ncbi:MAG: orotidine 5'-phosphate decarboxylase / HUMPS family protein [Coriobacteriales bacterium]|nr:orotidine 5'-phosphate decarboxylase / HUMPS family protein [Coriobacteriales bacterium]
MAAQLQLVFDHGKRHELIRGADQMADYVDIIEIGYPELITFGLDVVKEIHDAHPNVKLCVDAKVFHGGSGVTRRCFEAGASIVTVLGSAPNPVIQQMVRHAREYDGAIMCDMDGIKRIGKRTAEVDALGVNYMSVSSGFLMEHEYDLNKRRHGSIFQVRPLELASAVKRNLLHARLAIGTGINEENIDMVMKLDPAIVMVGRGIYYDPNSPNEYHTASIETRVARIDALKARMG